MSRELKFEVTLSLGAHAWAVMVSIFSCRVSIAEVCVAEPESEVDNFRLGFGF